MSGYVEYDSNNSGGSWWLKDEDWKALEAAGWKVAWATLEHDFNEDGSEKTDDAGMPLLVPYGEGNKKWRMSAPKDGRWLGALAHKAYRAGLSLRDAAEEWEAITGARATDAGCPCCGQPHHFTEYDADGKYVRSGPETSYSAGWA